MSSKEPEAGDGKASPSESSSADVSAAVEELLNTLSSKFASVSSEIFAKSKKVIPHEDLHAKIRLTEVDEMSRRLDSLEAALQESKDKDGSAPKP